MPEPRIHHEVLPNGLTLLLRETHLAPVANLQLWVQVGSADERPGEQGLAHFHEHMLFKGTERRGVGEVAGEIEGAGGRVNAYTSFDVTVYYATLPSAVLGTGLDVLSDAIRNSVFDPDEVKREVEVVLEEIRRSDDSPVHVLSEAVFAEAYHEHPYRSPILGPAENVARFDREMVRAFFERWYRPNHMVVVAAGDFDSQELAAEVRAAFEDAEPGGATRSRPSEPKHQGMRHTLVRRPFQRVKLDLSWPSVSFSDADATHLELLSFVLGECESSRLVRRVKERDALVDRIDSSSYTPLDPGLFSVSIEADANHAPDAIAASSREVERLRTELVSPEELERARANFLASEHFERESVSGTASKLGSFQVLGGDWRGEAKHIEAVRSATPEDLRRVAQKYLAPDQLTIGALWPEGASDPLTPEAVEAAVARGVDETRRAFAAPSRGAVRAQSAIHSYVLANGAQLHVKPRREVPVVAVRAAFLGGLLAETEAHSGLTQFVTSMWLRGTRSRSAADLARAIENLAVEVDGFAGRNSLGVSVEATTDQLEPALDLMAEILIEPGFDLDEIERERRDTLAAIERRADRLAQQAFMLFGETLFREHPYRLSLIGQKESVASFDAEMLRAHHARLIRADNLVIGVAGDVDPDAIAEVFSSRLSSLEAGDFVPPCPATEEAPSEIRTATRRVERAQAHLVLGFQGLTVSDPDHVVLEVMAQLLAGQSGRLFLELRDRRSLAYSVSAINVEGVAPGYFGVYIATAPEKVEDARRGILEELERLVSEPPADDELAHAVRYLTGNFAIDQQRNATHAGQMALDALYGLGPDNSSFYVERASAVSKEDILRVARRVLQLDAYTLALVGDVS